MYVYSHSHIGGLLARLEAMGTVLAAKQARRGATAERLLAAAIHVIDSVNLEGTTVPRIAAAAGVAPTSIYRRYADNDALLRAAFLHALASSNQNSRQMTVARLLKKDLQSTETRLITSLFKPYRRHPLLMRGLAS